MSVYPTSGTYGSILQAYFGAWTSSAKQTLWNNFLSTEGVTTTPPDSKAVDFLNFVQFQANNLGNIIQSPEEVQKRKIMFALFTSILNMLSTIQNTVTVEADNLVFLTRWEQQYTKMLTSTPVYISNPTSTMQVSTDPSQFTFGYNNISINDISSYVAQTEQTSSLGAGTYVLQTPDILGLKDINSTGTVNSHLSLNLIMASDPSGVTLVKVSISQVNTASGPHNGVTSSLLLETLSSIVPNATQASLTAAANSLMMQILTTPSVDTSTSVGFTSALAYNLATSTKPPTYTFTGTPSPAYPNNTPFTDVYQGFSIPWRDAAPYPNPTNAPLNSAQEQQNSDVSGKRAELNSLFQQYIQNTTAKRQIIQNDESNVQNNLSTTKDDITQEGALLTSLIQTWQTLLSSIFR